MCRKLSNILIFHTLSAKPALLKKERKSNKQKAREQKRKEKQRRKLKKRKKIKTNIEETGQMAEVAVLGPLGGALREIIVQNTWIQ